MLETYIKKLCREHLAKSPVVLACVMVIAVPLFLFIYGLSTGYAGEKRFLGERNYYLSEVNLLRTRKETLRLNPKNVEYDYVISDKGTLLMNISFDGGMIPSIKLMRETEDEYVELTIPDLDYEINKYPLLTIMYRIEDPAVQYLNGKLGIDLTGDGRVDRTIYFRKELILQDWVKSGAGNNTMDFYETRLLKDWPKAYNTKDSSQGKFRVYKNGVPLEPTYGGWVTEADLPVPGWPDYQELVEIGGIKHNRVVITVPKGESPQDNVYTVSYLPPAGETETPPGFNRLEVNLKETVGQEIEKIREAKLVSIFLYLGKTPGIDCSTPDMKGTYSFEIKGVSVYKEKSFVNPVILTITLALFFIIIFIKAKKLGWLLLITGLLMYISLNLKQTTYFIKEFKGLESTSMHSRKDASFYSICRKSTHRGEGALLAVFVHANLKGKLKVLVFPRSTYGFEALVPGAIYSRMVPYMYPATKKNRDYGYTLSSTEYDGLQKHVVASEKGRYRSYRIVELPTKVNSKGIYALYKYGQEIFIVAQGWRKLKED